MCFNLSTTTEKTRKHTQTHSEGIFYDCNGLLLVECAVIFV